MAKNNAVFVRLSKHGKTLHFSTGASAAFAGYSEAELWEKDGVVAVRPTIREAYHLSREEGRLRKALSNSHLVAHLCEKFRCVVGDTLPGWLGEDGALFFGKMQAEGECYQIDESYYPLELAYNRRMGGWVYVHDNWIEISQEMRALLPHRLAAFQAGHAVLLLGELKGELELSPKRQAEKPVLVSDVLADQLRRIYGGVKRGMRLRAVPVLGGIALADSAEALTTIPTERYRLNLDKSQNRFLSVGKCSIYLSSSAWQALGEAKNVGLYAYGDYVALRTERTGPFAIIEREYSHNIYSMALQTLLSTRWPGVKRLYLVQYGGLFLLCASPSRPDEPPDMRLFQKCTLDVVPPPAESAHRNQKGPSVTPTGRNLSKNTVQFRAVDKVSRKGGMW